MDVEILSYLLKGGASSGLAYVLWRLHRADKRADRAETKIEEYGRAMLAHVEKLTNSISDLNVTVARYTERTESLDKRLTRIEDKN